MMEFTFLTFLNVPMPGTDNHAYITVFKGRTPIRVPSPSHRLFKTEMKHWSLLHSHAIAKAKVALMGANSLSIEFILHFPPQKLITKSKAVKKMDASNRIKTLSDAISEILGIDDSIFWKISVQKVASNELPHVTVKIKNDPTFFKEATKVADNP